MILNEGIFGGVSKLSRKNNKNISIVMLDLFYFLMLFICRFIYYYLCDVELLFPLKVRARTEAKNVRQSKEEEELYIYILKSMYTLTI